MLPLCSVDSFPFKLTSTNSSFNNHYKGFDWHFKTFNSDLYRPMLLSDRSVLIYFQCISVNVFNQFLLMVWDQDCLNVYCLFFPHFFRLCAGGASRGHATVSKPVWEGRSIHQVWSPVPWEQLDQSWETYGMRVVYVVTHVTIQGYLCKLITLLNTVENKFAEAFKPR